MDLASDFHAEFSLVLRLLAGMAAGIIIGIDRTRQGKNIGVRTFGLVGLGSAAITAAFSDAETLDAASRVVQGLLTGVGFVGAGVILHRQGDDQPQGLTTAAAVWVTAALGAAAGLAAWAVVATGTVLALLLLLANERLEKLFGRRD